MQLDALAALPARAAQMACDMQRQPLAFQQQLAERRVGHAEGASLDARAVGACERAADMRLLDARERGDKRCAGKTKRGSGWPGP